MSEAFLLAAGHFPPDEGGFSSWLHACKVSPAWLTEIHLVSNRPGHRRSIPTHHWPVGSLETQRLLNLLIHEIEMDQVDLLAFIQNRGEQDSGLLVGSPAALGRRNLLPSARLAGFSLPQPADIEADTAAIRKILDGYSIDTKDIFQISSPEKLDASWQNLGKNLKPAILFSLDIQLVPSLMKILSAADKPGKAGVFLQPQAGLATLVEAV